MDGSFVYHRISSNLQGTILYPLNKLKEIYPNVFEEQIQKYVSREHVLETKIPAPLNCLWNDTLHFTTVHPQTLFKNLEGAGYNPKEIASRRWFKVPIKLFDSTNTIVCLYRRDIRLVSEAHDFYPFDPEKIGEYREVPEETIRYYTEQFVLGKRPLFFHGVPHILFKGTVDTVGLEIIEL